MQEATVILAYGCSVMPLGVINACALITDDNLDLSSALMACVMLRDSKWNLYFLQVVRRACWTNATFQQPEAGFVPDVELCDGEEKGVVILDYNRNHCLTQARFLRSPRLCDYVESNLQAGRRACPV